MLKRSEWKYWNPDKQPFINNPKHFYKVSICTTCMNRLHDLERTLPINILNNISYPDIEFVLVNYNSGDNLDKWAFEKLMPHIKSGIVKYVKTDEPKFFEMGHSRNIAFKVASGDIVNNVDADNYTGYKFAHAINCLANMQPRKAVFTKGKRLMHGRVGFFKDEFIKLGGYDESMSGYGADDRDLVERSQMDGHKMMWWNNLGDFMNRIKTPKSKVDTNMSEKWKITEDRNKKIAENNLKQGKATVNEDKHWGKAKLLVNFEENIEI